MKVNFRREVGGIQQFRRYLILFPRGVGDRGDARSQVAEVCSSVDNGQITAWRLDTSVAVS